MMVSVREPAVAGAFYPADAHTLRATVDACLRAAGPPAPGSPPKAIIAPHAGYVYSGAVAGSAYAPLRALAGTIERVVLLGPAHRVFVEGLAVPSVDAFVTPLGAVEIDAPARDVALRHSCVVVDDAAHAPEHSLEVQLPFLQCTLLTGFRVLPLVVGRAGVADVAAVLEALWGGPETLIVVSSDLSHYEPYRSAAVHDRRTAQAIVDGAADSIAPTDACGAYPVRGLLAATRRHGLRAELLDLRNSGDTAGPTDRVVGYGAFAFSAPTSEAR